MKRIFGETASIKEAARDILIKILENYAERVSNDVSSLRVSEQKFILDCYRASVEEQVSQKMIDFSQLSETDLKEIWEQSLAGNQEN